MRRPVATSGLALCLAKLSMEINDQSLVTCLEQEMETTESVV